MKLVAKRPDHYIMALAGLVMALAVLVLTARDSAATHGLSLVELDANTANGVAAGTDWDALFGGATPSGLLRYRHVADPFEDHADDAPSLGGTKDIHDFNPSAACADCAWHWTPSPVPDKNDIENVMAAYYSYSGGTLCPTGQVPAPPGQPDQCTQDGDLIVYTMLDKRAVEGSNFAGFWFLQDDVSETTNLQPHHNKFHFDGTHIEGDILAVVDYTQGGRVNTIKLWKWRTSCVSGPGVICVDDNLQEIFVGVDCTLSDVNDPACGRVVGSDQTVVPAWTFAPKGGADGDAYPSGAFLEVGVNVTAFLGTVTCFNTFIGETRASHSPDAILHDIALGTAPLCRAQVATNSSQQGFVTAGDAVTDTATVTKTADTPAGAPNPSGKVQFFICGPLASATGCTTGTQVGAPPEGENLAGGNATSDAFNVTSSTLPGFYCWRANYTGDNNYPAAGSTTAANECFRVRQPSTTTTQSSQTGIVTNGASVTDTATVSISPLTFPPSPVPTGSVAFTLCGPNASENTSSGCGAPGPAVPIDCVAPGSSCTATSASFSVTANTVPGFYCWKATYTSGDDNYTGSASTTTVNECFRVRQPTTTTTLSSETGIVTNGASVTDTATVSISPLTFPPSPVPTGSVVFTLCGPNASESTSSGCGAPGAPVAISCVSPGSSCTATSAAFGVTADTVPGFYCWKATYTSGDDNYTGSASTTTVNECFRVRQPTTTTTQSSETGIVTTGASVTDTATVSISPLTSPPAPAPTGTVTFYICGPLASANGCAAGTQVGSPKAISASSPFQATSDPLSASGLAVGFYCWRAVYTSGDDNYTGSESTSPTNECFQAPSTEGCTPGFWTGGNGSQLWNTANDPQWAAVIGGTNPFTHATLFESFFQDPGSQTDTLTMFDAVSGGGGPDPVLKAARDLVAGYLNASAGLNYPFSTTQLLAMWSDAIDPATAYDFDDFHADVGTANELGCPF